MRHAALVLAITLAGLLLMSSLHVGTASAASCTEPIMLLRGEMVDQHLCVNFTTGNVWYEVTIMSPDTVTNQLCPAVKVEEFVDGQWVKSPDFQTVHPQSCPIVADVRQAQVFGRLPIKKLKRLAKTERLQVTGFFGYGLIPLPLPHLN